MNKITIFTLLFLSIAALADADGPKMSADSGYVEPFRMFDNVYYVGDRWVSSYAVETSFGLVLIDTLELPYSKWIPINLKKLGLDDKKVTHIFVTHGHSDHVGGAQFLQSIYGSRVVMSEKGLELAKTQATESKDESKFLPPVVESFAEDSSNMVVGDTKFTFYMTPGHTEGDMSIDFMVKDNGHLYRAFVVGGHGTNFKRPDLAKKFMASMARIKRLSMESPAVAVNLSNHPHKNSLFSNRDRVIKDVTINPFISRENFSQFIEQQEKSAIEKFGLPGSTNAN